MSGVKQRFTTGSVAATGNQFDMAIDGASGFFRVVDSSGAVNYTRNGQFFEDKNGFIVNAQMQRLTGHMINPNTGIPGAALESLTVPRGNMAPQATQNIATVANFDSNAKEIDSDKTPFDLDDPTTYSKRVSSQVFDSRGNSHELAQYYVRNAGNHWTVFYALDGKHEPGHLATKIFDESGRMTPTSNPVPLTFGVPGALPLSVKIDYTGSTSFAKDFSASFKSDGYAAGEYLAMTVGKDGTLQANYSNGQSKAVAQLALANFANVQGLQPVGGNAWVETAESGSAVMGQPGSNGLATIKGQAVEESNVDMSQELVNMIIAQRTYQANAQTIKTQDQVLQTLITMR